MSALPLLGVAVVVTVTVGVGVGRRPPTTPSPTRVGVVGVWGLARGFVPGWAV